MGAWKVGASFLRTCLLRQLPSQVGGGGQCPGWGPAGVCVGGGPSGLGCSLSPRTPPRPGGLGRLCAALPSPPSPGQPSPRLRSPPHQSLWLHAHPAGKYLGLRVGGTRNERELIPKPQGSRCGGRRGLSLSWVLPVQVDGVAWRLGDKQMTSNQQLFPWRHGRCVC